MARIPLTDSVIDRFWSKVLKADGCWEWTDYPGPSGHGRLGIQVDGKTRPFYAHRVSWEIHFGEIPDGMVVMHECDNPACVRPDHLRLGTTAENIADARAKGRWHNDPARKKTVPRKAKPTVAERFWPKVAKEAEGECWSWTGWIGAQGYGLFWMAERGRKVVASRVAYELANGSISPGLIVRHTCDNRRCVNPAHLILGTHADNMRDRDERNRRPPPTGTKNGRAKLIESEVAEIRAALARGERQQAIADRYGIHQTQVSRLGRGVAWSHLARSAVDSSAMNEADEPVPILTGAGGLTGRPLLPARIPDEYEEPGSAPPRTVGAAMPANCRRVLSSPRPSGCTAGCEGLQRDGGCLCDVVRAAQAARVAWRFEVDPHDHRWDYAGDPIPGFVTRRGDYGQVHTRWEEGQEPRSPLAPPEPGPPPSFDCPHCGSHNEQDLSNFHFWCAACGRNANEGAA